MDVKPNVSFPLLFCGLIEFLNLFVAVTSYYIDKEMQIARLELEGCGGIAGRRGERTEKGFLGRRNEGPPPLCWESRAIKGSLFSLWMLRLLPDSLTF